MMSIDVIGAGLSTLVVFGTLQVSRYMHAAMTEVMNGQKPHAVKLIIQNCSQSCRQIGVFWVVLALPG